MSLASLDPLTRPLACSAAVVAAVAVVAVVAVVVVVVVVVVVAAVVLLLLLSYQAIYRYLCSHMWMPGDEILSRYIYLSMFMFIYVDVVFCWSFAICCIYSPSCSYMC